MKLDQVKKTLVRSDEFTKAAFEIDNQNVGMILHIMRNQMYSDKVLAPIREYSTNAVDAMVEDGKGDQAILIHLPTELNPEWKVRDFGKGLDHKEICNLYTKYGASTKRDSNDFTGMLGIGCKSGFAYGDTFIITAWKDGIKRVYSAAIDEANVGHANLMHEQGSSEPSGVEISIPVRGDDHEVFRTKTFNLCRHFKVRPQFDNVDEETLEKELSSHTKVQLEGDGWKIYQTLRAQGRHSYSWSRHQERKAHAIMGNIPYQISKEGFSNLSDVERDYLDYVNIDMEFKIGELTIAASREALEYTDKTQQNIKNMIAKVSAEVQQKFSDKLKSSKNLWDAKQNYKDMLEELPSELCKVIRNSKPTWTKGKFTTTRFDTYFELHENDPNDKHTTIWYKTRKYMYAQGQRYNSDYKYKSEESQRIDMDGFKENESIQVHLCHYDPAECTPQKAALKIRTLQRAVDEEDKKRTIFYLLEFSPKNLEFYTRIGMLDTPDGVVKDLKNIESYIAPRTPAAKGTPKAKAIGYSNQSGLYPLTSYPEKLNEKEQQYIHGATHKVLYMFVKNKTLYEAKSLNKNLKNWISKEPDNLFHSRLFKSMSLQDPDFLITDKAPTDAWDNYHQNRVLVGVSETCAKGIYEKDNWVHLSDWLPIHLKKWVENTDEAILIRLMEAAHIRSHEEIVDSKLLWSDTCLRLANALTQCKNKLIQRWGEALLAFDIQESRQTPSHEDLEILQELTGIGKKWDKIQKQWRKDQHEPTVPGGDQQKARDNLDNGAYRIGKMQDTVKWIRKHRKGLKPKNYNLLEIQKKVTEKYPLLESVSWQWRSWWDTDNKESKDIINKINSYAR